MVREREGPSADPVTLRVSLPDDANEAERVAERALATVIYLIERGAPVLLGTVERSGSILEPVEDRRAAGRRLAKAVATARRGDARPHPDSHAGPPPGIEVAP
jgi:hypothetical protein